jgi:hypothetical protein
LIVHRTSDGTRTIELLGPDDGEIRFQGVFSGPNAQARARGVNNLRLTGAPVWLTWQSSRYKVIVESFSAIYHNQWWISYNLSCVVVHQPGVASSGVSATLAVILDALSSAGGPLVAAGVDISTPSTAITGPSALTPGSSTHSLAVTVAGDSLSAIQAEIEQQSGTLINSCQTSIATSEAASSFADQVQCSASLANAANARSYIGLICISLGQSGA